MEVIIGGHSCFYSIHVSQLSVSVTLDQHAPHCLYYQLQQAMKTSAWQIQMKGSQASFSFHFWQVWSAGSCFQQQRTPIIIDLTRGGRSMTLKSKHWSRRCFSCELTQNNKENPGQRNALSSMTLIHLITLVSHIILTIISYSEVLHMISSAKEN